MAKKSKVEKDKRQRRTVKVYAERRAELMRTMYDPSVSEEEADSARKKFQKLPRDSSPSRLRNRCHLTGRPRAFYRRFGLCRLLVREKALQGELPGVTKASW